MDKTKCRKCNSTLVLKITDMDGNVVKFQCFNCGEEFNNILPFKRFDQDPEEIIG